MFHSAAERVVSTAQGGLTSATAADSSWTTYTYDALGRRTTMVDPERNAPGGVPGEHTWTTAYDASDRIIGETDPLGLTNAESFVLDGASNVTARTGPTAAFTYDQANRLTHDGTVAYTWSTADRLVARGSDSFTYDALDRLTSSTVAGTPWTYSYDGDGLLTSRSGTLGPTALLWDPSSSPQRLLQVGSDRLVHGLGPLYASTATGTVTFARDGLGSVRAEVNDVGLMTGSFRYRAYGEIAQFAGAGPTYLGYAGELVDTSGLIYLRARWYDPLTGRLLTQDPVRGDAKSPVTLNAYLYAHASPVVNTDPTGRCPICILPVALLAPEVLAAATAAAATATYLAVRYGPTILGWAQRWGIQAERGLEAASSAAFRAADAASSFVVSAKHQPWAAGSASKFAEGVDVQGIVAAALRSAGAKFMPDPTHPDRLRVVTDFAEVVGTKGQTRVRVVIDFSGNIITAFPVHVQ